MKESTDYHASQQQPPPSSQKPDTFAPGRAALCAMIPGIGAVYNREYMKAVIHFSIFAGLVIVAGDVGVFGVAAVSYYVYTIIDAYRSAESIAQRGGPDAIQADDEELNLPLWGSVLLLMGVVFLLDNLGAIRLRSAIQFWPLILVFLGAYLIFTYMQRSKHGTPPSKPTTSYRPRREEAPLSPPSKPSRPVEEEATQEVSPDDGRKEE